MNLTCAHCGLYTVNSIILYFLVFLCHSPCHAEWRDSCHSGGTEGPQGAIAAPRQPLQVCCTGKGQREHLPHNLHIYNCVWCVSLFYAIRVCVCLRVLVCACVCVYRLVGVPYHMLVNMAILPLFVWWWGPLAAVWAKGLRWVKTPECILCIDWCLCICFA